MFDKREVIERVVNFGIGYQIRKHRLAHKISQTKLANFLGISHRVLINIERGKGKKIPASYIYLVASVFDVKIYEFFPLYDYKLSNYYRAKFFQLSS